MSILRPPVHAAGRWQVQVGRFVLSVFCVAQRTMHRLTLCAVFGTELLSIPTPPSLQASGVFGTIRRGDEAINKSIHILWFHTAHVLHCPHQNHLGVMIKLGPSVLLSEINQEFLQPTHMQENTTMRVRNPPSLRQIFAEILPATRITLHHQLG